MRETMKSPDHEGNQALLGVQLKDIEKTLPLRVLSEEDWEHWTTWGYVIVHDAIPPDHIERLKAFLWKFQEMDPNDPSTWNATDRRAHGMTELNNSGMVEVYNHQLLWDTRQSPRVYDAYVDIWDREDLWVTIDRGEPEHTQPGRAQVWRFHPLGCGHVARSAARQRAGGAVPRGYGRGSRRIAMRA